jgi:hypothetical protein
MFIQNYIYSDINTIFILLPVKISQTLSDLIFNATNARMSTNFFYKRGFIRANSCIRGNASRMTHRRLQGMGKTILL